MTGESMPADVTVGDTVLGGTVCVGGRLVVKATRLGADTHLAHMLRLVEEAQNQKANVQRLADRIAGVFVPAVIGVALLTLAGWLLAGGTNEEAFERGAFRADHRVPVRTWPGDSHRADGGLR